MITLENFTEQDFDRLISWVKSEEELIRFAGPLFQYPLTRSQLQAYLLQTSKHPYRIRLDETGAIIGHCELNYERQIPRLSRILIGDPALRNKGIGKQIIREMIKLVFTTTDYSMIDLSVFDWNANAIRCYQQLGFVIRPELQTSMTVSSKIWNAHNMLLEKETYQKTPSDFL